MMFQIAEGIAESSNWLIKELPFHNMSVCAYWSPLLLKTHSFCELVNVPDGSIFSSFIWVEVEPGMWLECYQVLLASSERRQMAIISHLPMSPKES